MSSAICSSDRDCKSRGVSAISKSRMEEGECYLITGSERNDSGNEDAKGILCFPAYLGNRW